MLQQLHYVLKLSQVAAFIVQPTEVYVTFKQQALGAVTQPQTIRVQQKEVPASRLVFLYVVGMEIRLRF